MADPQTNQWAGFEIWIDFFVLKNDVKMKE